MNLQTESRDLKAPSPDSESSVAGAGLRIVYLQYTNPAGYPPLEHSSLILAGLGCQVRFLGAAAHGAETLMFPKHPSIRVTRLPRFGAGVLLKLNYVTYVLWTFVICLIWRPRWVYASEALAAPSALLLKRVLRCSVIFHEHDTPTDPARPGLLQRWLQAARLRISRDAEICILPQPFRLHAFVLQTGREGETDCVLNCPLRNEVAPARHDTDLERPFRFYYHGSLNQDRLPSAVLDALAAVSSTATLVIVGYETVGSGGYVADFLGRARALGLGERVRYVGALSARRDLLAEAGKADVGLAFMPKGIADINMMHMAGASNKPFDYLAVGAALLVSDLPEWREMFVNPGFAFGCDPADVVSLTAAMKRCVDNPLLVRQMGELGRQRILRDWNYETQFAPVADKVVPFLGASAARRDALPAK